MRVASTVVLKPAQELMCWAPQKALRQGGCKCNSNCFTGRAASSRVTITKKGHRSALNAQHAKAVVALVNAQLKPACANMSACTLQLHVELLRRSTKLKSPAGLRHWCTRVPHNAQPPPCATTCQEAGKTMRPFRVGGIRTYNGTCTATRHSRPFALPMCHP